MLQERMIDDHLANATLSRLSYRPTYRGSYQRIW